jgi:ABC-type amino acid transport substrate-binding protein
VGSLYPSHLQIYVGQGLVRMRKRFRIAAFLFTAFLIVFISLSPSQGAGAGGRVIYAVGDRALDPFEFISETQVPTGFLVELLQSIARQKELSLNFRMVRWQEVPALLYSSHVDLLLGVADARGNDAILPRLAPVVNIPAMGKNSPVPQRNFL